MDTNKRQWDFTILGLALMIVGGMILAAWLGG
jgi:hypothetical protein